MASFMGLADQVDDMSEAERLDKYISGLKYEIQYEVRRSRPTTFMEAVRLAESTDALMQYARTASREGIHFRGQTHRATINVIHTLDRPPKGPCYRFFRDLLDRCVIVYLDDILIFTKTREQHLRDLDAVFKRLQENRLITKGSKCEFLKQELEFLGHVVSRDGIKIDPANIKTIQEWKSLTNITELQSFLGFVNYVRRFIPNMAGITADLIPPSSRRGARVPGDAEPAFPATRSAPSQSRKLQAAEHNYPIHDKEMLAIIHAFKLWRCYLVGANIIVRTDHKSLQYLRAQPNLNPRQIRWLDYMESHFTYHIT
ncbi:unnamed protein product [Closterium sp. NIES-53]